MSCVACHTVTPRETVKMVVAKGGSSLFSSKVYLSCHLLKTREIFSGKFLVAFNGDAVQMYNSNMWFSFSQTKVRVYLAFPYAACHFSSVLI